MQKTLIILLLATVVLCKSMDSYVVSSTLQNGDSIELNTAEFGEALSRIFGAVSSTVPSKNAINLISSIGKKQSSVFKPTQSGLMVLVHGNFDSVQQKSIAGTGANVSIQLGDEDESKVLSSIFDKNNKESLVNTSVFSSNKSFYLFSQDNSSDIFNKIGVSLSLNQWGKVNVNENQTGKTHKRQALADCVKSALNGSFEVNGNTISDKKTGESVLIEEQNFFLELCSMDTIISSFKESIPSFVILEVSSLKNLQSSFSEENFAFAQKVVSQTISKVVKHFETLQKNSVFSQILFVNDGKQIFNGDHSAFTQARTLAAVIATPEEAIAAQGYTLRAWFSIFFVALIFFVCYALFNVEIVKDSLLYAKFIADDRK